MERPIKPKYDCVNSGQIFMFMEIVDLKISKQIKQWTCAGLGLYRQSQFSNLLLEFIAKISFLPYLGWEEALCYASNSIEVMVSNKGMVFRKHTRTLIDFPWGPFIIQRDNAYWKFDIKMKIWYCTTSVRNIVNFLRTATNHIIS